MRNVPERLLRQGDLFRGVLDDGQDLIAAIDGIGDLI
jgi:hypothetical protein